MSSPCRKGWPWLGLVGMVAACVSMLSAACAARSTPRAEEGAPAVLAPSPAPPTPTPRRVLRVAADPNNMPFSNDRLEGFDNKIAQIIAADLGAEVQWVWRAQRRGFFRETLKDGKADMVVGVTTGSERATTTRPLYRSTYAFVSRADRGLDITSLDDPRLRTLRVGVQLIGDDGTNTPPAHALAARGVVDNLVGYSVYGDYREPNPPARIVRAVREGEVDVAVVWGPLAAYFAGGDDVLVIRPISPGLDGPSGLPLVFDISVGVAKGNTALRDELDAVVAHRKGDIDRVLAGYRVPRGEPGVTLPRMGDDD